MSLPNLLNQVITIYPKSSYDAFGKETFGSSTSYEARIQEVTKSRLLPNGQTVTIDGIVYLDGNPSVAINDKITYGGVSYKIYGKSTAVDGQGNVHHTKLELMKIV